MIKLAVLDSILKKYTRQGMIAAADYQFKTAYNTKGEAFVGDLEFKNFGQIPSDDMKFYMQEGYNNFSAVSASLPVKKQFDPMSLPQGLVLYTGFFSTEAAIGVDTSKSKVTSIFTRSETILRELFKEGAFEDSYTKEDLDTDIEKLEKKIGTGIEKGALSFARLDLINAMSDAAIFKITLPNFRTDIGDTLKFYPYGVFPYLANLMKETVKDNAKTVMQNLQDGNIKVRKISFTDKAVKVLYKGFESTMVENKIRKAKPGWDVLSLNIKAYNLEGSLYSKGYTNINLEDMLQISSCKLSEVDKTQYAVNYDELRKHFRASVNKWNLSHYNDFRGTDLNSYPTKDDKKEALMRWLESVDDITLYNIMKYQEELFGGDLEQKLDKVANDSPKEFKELEYVELPEDTEEKLKKVKEMLKNGVVRLAKTSKKSNKVSEVVCTNNGILLSRILGKNYVEKYESIGIKIQYLKNILEKTNLIDDFSELEKKIYAMGINNYMDVSTLDKAAFEATVVENKVIEDEVTKELMIEYAKELKSKGKSDAEIDAELSLPNTEKKFRNKAKTTGVFKPYLQSASAIEGSKDNVRETSGGNPNIVRYKKVYADSEKDFYGSVDIENIISVEYAELGKK